MPRFHLGEDERLPGSRDLADFAHANGKPFTIVRPKCTKSPWSICRKISDYLTLIGVQAVRVQKFTLSRPLNGFLE